MANTTVSQLRAKNIKTILSILERNSPLKSSDISKLSNLSIVSINNIINELIATNLVTAQSDKIKTGGRHAKLFELDYSNYYLLIIQIFEKGKNIIATASLCDLQGNNQSPKELDQEIQNYIDLETFISSSVDRFSHEVSGIVIGIPGAVAKGVVKNSDLKTLTGINLSSKIKEYTGIKTFILNDVNAMIYGVMPEINEQNKMIVDSAIALYYPEHNKPGAGLIIKDSLVIGANGLAGEIIYSSNSKLYDNIDKASDSFVNVIVKDIQNVVSIIDPNYVIVFDENKSSPELIKEKLNEDLNIHHNTKLVFKDNAIKNFKHGLVRFGREQIYSFITQNI